MASTSVKTALILGGGAAGAVTALALSKQGWKTKVVKLGPGATGLSSGAWDLGVVPVQAPSLESFFEQTIKHQLSRLFVDWDEVPTYDSLAYAIEDQRALLAPHLEITVSADLPMILPCTQGTLRDTFVAQGIQAKANLRLESVLRIGVVCDPLWNYPGLLLCERWNRIARERGLRAQFVPFAVRSRRELVDLETASLLLAQSAAMRMELIDSIRPLKSQCDLLLLPPLCLSTDLEKEIEHALGVPVAEPLCSRETIAGRRLDTAWLAALANAGVSTTLVQSCRIAWRAGHALGIEYTMPSAAQGQAAGKGSADEYVIASGRFVGRGFVADGTRWETSTGGVPLSLSKGTVWNETRAPYTDGNNLGVSVDGRFRARTFAGLADNVRATGSCIGGVDLAENKLGLGILALLGSECAKKMAAI